MSRLFHRAASAAGLCGALALLMADSAADPCSVVPFDRTFIVTSSCPEYGSETIRITLDNGPDATSWPAEVEHVDGEPVVIAAEVGGGCSDSGDPVEYDGLTLSLRAADGAELRCIAYFEGSESVCFEPSETDCTLTIEEVEARR